MVNLYPDSNILHDHTILIDAVEKSNITNILANRLNGTMTVDDFSKKKVVSDGWIF